MAGGHLAAQVSGTVCLLRAETYHACSACSSVIRPTVDFATAVHRQSWEWFLDFPYRLNLAAEILDDKGVPILPALEGQVAATLRRLITTSATAPLRAALAATMESRTCQLVERRAPRGRRAVR